VAGGAVRLAEFRERVFREFGPRLERATPENVRLFLADLDLEGLSRTSYRSLDLDAEESVTLEGAIRSYFARALREDPETAAVALWSLAFELFFAIIEVDLDDRFRRLFGGPGDEGSP
jgi:hypothetical protein